MVDDVETLYRELLAAWNGRDADRYGALFDDAGSIVGFDGTCVDTRGAIVEHLQAIFGDHEPARYVAKVREVRQLSPDVALLRSVAGMVPPGADDIKPDVNAIQGLVAVRRGDNWRVAHFQNTPASFDGRPDESAAYSEELRAVLRGAE